MIQEAERLSKEFRVEHTDWFIGDIEKYYNINNTTFRFVTIAKAFHWMDRPKVLDSLYERIANGGGIAIIDNYSPNDVLLPWQEKVQEVVKHWYGNERRAGNITYSHHIPKKPFGIWIDVVSYTLLKIKETNRPSEANKPTIGPPSSKASGIMVDASMAIIPPPAKEAITANVNSDAPSKKT